MAICEWNAGLYRQIVKNGRLPVASDGSEGTVVHAQWDIKSNDGLTSSNHLEVLRVDAGLLGGIIEVHLNLFEEATLTVLVGGKLSGS